MYEYIIGDIWRKDKKEDWRDEESQLADDEQLTGNISKRMK